MKRLAIAGFAVVVIAVLSTVLYGHSLSVDRARLVHSANDLLVAQQQLQQNGVLTNQVRVQLITNPVTIGGVVFQCVMAATPPELADAGSLVAATDGTLIWIDKTTGPVVFRGSDKKIVIPERFKRL